MSSDYTLDFAQIQNKKDLVSVSVERKMKLADIVDLYIDYVLECTGGNKSKAAVILGIDRRTLHRKAKRSSCRQPEFPRHTYTNAPIVTNDSP